MEIFDGRWNADLKRWECEICGGTAFRVMELAARYWVLESGENGGWQLVRIDPWEEPGHFSDVYCLTCDDGDHYLNGSGQMSQVDLKLRDASTPRARAESFD